MQTVVIFGANGQDGYYLAELYRKQGWKVLGVSRTGDWLRGDVGSFEYVEKIVKSCKPDVIFHLAANSTTRHEAIFENHKTIGTGTLNILEAVYRWQPGCKVFLAGSGLQFLNTGAPIHETDSFDANSAYCVDRIHSVYAARYFRNLGVKVYVGYLFHHESPLRKLNHMSQKIVQTVKRISGGSDECLECGDPSVRKEWAFAGDIAEAMSIFVGQEQIFEVVIGVGKTNTIEDWLDVCFNLIGKDWKNYVSLSDGFSAEYNCLVSNPSTMYSLGWRPKIDFAELAELMIRY